MYLSIFQPINSYPDVNNENIRKLTKATSSEGMSDTFSVCSRTNSASQQIERIAEYSILGGVRSNHLQQVISEHSR